MQSPRLRSRAAGALLSALIVLSLSGCSAKSAYQGPGYIESRGMGLTLSVVNRNVEDVRVYVLRETTSMAIGTVRAMGSRSFKISKTRLGCSNVLRLAVVAKPSHTQFNPTPLEYEIGQAVEAHIGTFLRHSRLHVFPKSLDY
jgi:hypothetical protein